MGIKRVVKVGDVALGGNNPIAIQTMANIKTSRIKEILEMEKDLSRLGNRLFRLSVLDEDDASAFKELALKSSTPLIADVHFNYLFAISALENGASAVRLNPGNISDPKQLKAVIECAKKHHAAIRIGVNSGSLPKDYQSKKDLASAYCQIMKDYLSFFEQRGFYDLVLSLKSSDPEITFQAYKMADAMFDYPLHIGVTEAGEGAIGAIRSCAALIPLLNLGIGNTIRISLTDPPREEVLAAKALLKSLNKMDHVPVLVSCPTCGRTQVDLMKVSRIVSKHLEGINKDIKVAIMGCPVNGPGEAKDADIGLAGGVSSFLVFKKGKPLKSLPEKEAVEFLLKEIDEIAAKMN